MSAEGFTDPPRGRRLHNDDWGFESNCFVCEPSNAGGLRVPFWADDEAERVVARYSLDETYSGAPSFVHGGVTLAILDEAAAWATIALAGRFAVTSESTNRFTEPVLVGEPYEARAWLVDTGEKVIRTSAEVRDARDRVCATAEATFVVLGEAAATEAIGGAVEGEARDYLR